MAENSQTIYNILGILIPCVITLIWLIRLEAKVLYMEKDNAKSDEINNSKLDEMNETLKKMVESSTKTNEQIIRMMSEMQHMNSRITNLESKKIEEILNLHNK